MVDLPDAPREITFWKVCERAGSLVGLGGFAVTGLLYLLSLPLALILVVASFSFGVLVLGIVAHVIASNSQPLDRVSVWRNDLPPNATTVLAIKEPTKKTPHGTFQDQRERRLSTEQFEAIRSKLASADEIAKQHPRLALFYGGPPDGEPRKFAKQLHQVIQAAGWKVRPDIHDAGYDGMKAVGVSIFVSSDEPTPVLMYLLRDALTSAGIDTVLDTAPTYEDEIRLLVGRKNRDISLPPFPYMKGGESR